MTKLWDWKAFPRNVLILLGLKKDEPRKPSVPPDPKGRS